MIVAFVLGELLASLVGIRGIVLICIPLFPGVLFFFISRADKFRLLVLFLVPALIGGIRMEQYTRMLSLPTEFRDSGYSTVNGDVYRIEEKSHSFAVYIRNVEVVSDGDPYQISEMFVTVVENPKLKVGNRIQSKGTLQKFSEATNFGQFDEADYYHSLGIVCKMKATDIEVTDSSYRPIQEALENGKSKFIRSLYDICDDSTAGLFAAILLGDKSDLSEDTKKLYQKNGIAHMLAVSGLHVSIIGLSVYRLLRKRFSYQVSGSISVFLLLCFGIMTGGGAATMRAVIMFVVLIGSEILGRSYDGITSLSLTGVLLLLDNPYYLYQCGFQLSFAAISAISIVTPIICNILGIKSKIGKTLCFNLCITMMTSPMIAFYYYELPTYSILVNLLTVPLVTLVTVSGGIGGFLGIFYHGAGTFFIGIGYYILKLYEWICTIGVKMPNSVIITGRPGIAKLACYYGVLIIFLFVFYIIIRRIGESKLLLRRLSGFFLLLILIMLLYSKGQHGFEVHFLDVGQGDGIVIRTPGGNTYMVDGGSTDVSEVGKYRLMPFLKASGISIIDYAIVTHADNDHVSGLKELLTEYEDSGIQIQYLVLPDTTLKDDAYMELVSLASEHQINLLYLSRGDIISDGDITFTCLHPYPGYDTDSRNAYSTVLSVSYGRFDMLLTGDIEGDGESSMLQSGFLKDYDVLKVAHHGSQYSTSEEFLTVTKPEISVISCGKDNSYGHPHKELIERLNKTGTRILITEEQGEIVIKSDGANLWTEY